jgi:hypothetical protein
MSKNHFDLRYGILRPDGYTFSVWRLWITKHSDVYLAAKSMAGIAKYSFHASGICRSAITKERSSTDKDRLMFRWKRNPSPPPENTEAVICVARIAYPTNFLSSPTNEGGKNISWIQAAQENHATILEFSFTRDTELSIRKVLENAKERVLFQYMQLPNLKESLMVTYINESWDNKDLRITSASSETGDLIASAQDPEKTGRPIKLVYGPTPLDGDFAMVAELGCYPKTDLNWASPMNKIPISKEKDILEHLRTYARKQ